MSPKLAIADGAQGFRAAVSKVFPETEHQRCWVHKSANILNRLPKSQQDPGKSQLHEIWMSASKRDALIAYEKFNETFYQKYPKAVENLAKDKDELFAFYDFPAEHWSHIRTTNPIESMGGAEPLRRFDRCGPNTHPQFA